LRALDPKEGAIEGFTPKRGTTKDPRGAGGLKEGESEAIDRAKHPGDDRVAYRKGEVYLDRAKVPRGG
jgi:hypothetical protein